MTAQKPAQKPRKSAKSPELQPAIAEAFGEKEQTEIVPEPEDMRLIVPTGSKTDLFLTCAWPWGRKAPREEVGEPAHFGSAFHELLAASLTGDLPTKAPTAIAKKWRVDVNPLLERHNAARPVLFKWLRGGNPYGLDFTRDMHVEKSFAVDLENFTPRAIANPTAEGHVYEDALPSELPMTLDLYATAKGPRGKTLLVLDHKSGFVRQDVSASGQLKSAAIAVGGCSEAAGFECIILAFLHAPFNCNPEVYALEVDRKELREHYRRLREAYRATLQPRRSLTQTDLCARCPGFAICPTNTTGLMDLRGGVGRLALATPEAIGKAHQALHAYKKRFEALYEVLDGEIKDAVGRVGFGFRPDGQTVAFKMKPYTQLSLASIDRNLPPEEARKLKAKLDKLGVIERGERPELRAGKPE
jgi:PD-(D/E)XK nuclease superfamily